jgi:hypothetical protein
MTRSYETLVRNQVDPDGVLPHVRLTKSLAPTDTRRAYIVQAVGDSIDPRVGVMVGTMIVARLSDDTVWYPSWTIVEKGYEGRGYGTSFYIATAALLQRECYGFRSSPHSLSLDAKRVWDRLVARGVAEVVMPYQPGIGNYTVMSGEIRFLDEDQLLAAQPQPQTPESGGATYPGSERYPGYTDQP